MNNTQWIALLIEVGVVALAAVIWIIATLGKR